MAYPGDPIASYPRETYPSQPVYGFETHETPPTTYGRERELREDDHRRPPHRADSSVTAGPFRFSLREGILGILALFAILGLVLGVLGFAAAFALDRAAEAVDGGGATTDDENALLGAAALPALLVSVLPFLAAPVLALGCGAWAGHASRSSRIGALAGAIGGFLGPILTILITGMGFALGAGAANLNLGNVAAPGGFGIAPGWGNTVPYLFTGAGLLWILANTLAGGLSGGVVGALLDRRPSARSERRRVGEHRSLRY